MLRDLQVREEERTSRETEVMKEMSIMNKVTHFATVEKNFKKMVRKICMLTFDKDMSGQGAHSKSQSLGYGVTAVRNRNTFHS